MPEIRYYTVTQEREVKLRANSPLEAAQIANKAFGDDEERDSVPAGSITSPVRERDLVVREDY